jgi:hypothetical protein
MTASPSPRAARSSVRRLIIWFVIAVIIVAGVVLYFRYAGQVVPLIGQDR